MKDTSNNPPSKVPYYTDVVLGGQIYSTPHETGSAAPPPPDFALLQEDGFAILQEDSSFILLE